MTLNQMADQSCPRGLLHVAVHDSRDTVGSLQDGAPEAVLQRELARPEDGLESPSPGATEPTFWIRVRHRLCIWQPDEPSVPDPFEIGPV